MAYDEELDSRISKAIARWGNTDRKKMFGGICYLLNGNMFSGVYKDFLILRLGEKGAEEALRSPHARPFDITGRPMRGWVMMDRGGVKGNEELKELLREAREFALSLPSK